jgi:5'-AMP-activated protein kinase regulatory beta subunit
MAAKKTSLKGEKKSQPVKKKVVFQLLAPEAQKVLLAGSFNNWANGSIELKKDKKGLWKTTLSLEPGSYEYLFQVDGEWKKDPECTNVVSNPFGGENCVITVA